MARDLWVMGSHKRDLNEFVSTLHLLFHAAGGDAMALSSSRFLGTSRPHSDLVRVRAEPVPARRIHLLLVDDDSALLGEAWLPK